MAEETIYKSEQKRSRRGIATFFRRLAQRLDRGENVPITDDQTIAFAPPADADFEIELEREDGEIELEREDGEIELEIEMSWTDTDGAVETDADESKATFQLFEDNAGEYRWRLRHDNGNVIADSGEGYASKQKARQGLESVKTNAAGGHVVDQSSDETIDTEEESKATFELFEDAGGKWRWRLRHDNGNIIADSGGGYTAKHNAKKGLRSVKTNALGAAVETED